VVHSFGFGAFRSTASLDAKSFGLVLMAESTVTPVPIPRTKIPARRALDTDSGRRRPSRFPKGEGKLKPEETGWLDPRSSIGEKFGVGRRLRRLLRSSFSYSKSS